MNLYFWSFTLCCITAFIFILILLYQSVVSFISWLKEKNYIYAIKILMGGTYNSGNYIN